MFTYIYAHSYLDTGLDSVSAIGFIAPCMSGHVAHCFDFYVNKTMPIPV